MKLKSFSKYDVQQYLKKYSTLYISFLILFLVGIILGVVVALSSDGYLKILNKENKILYSIINGTVSGGSIFWNRMMSLIFPLIIIFVLGLNFYTCILSYVIVAYQSSLLTLTIFAVVSTYGVSGVLNSLFIILPINLLYIAVMIFFASICLRRSYLSKKNKIFDYGFKENEFIAGVLCSCLAVLIICVIGVVIIPMILKSAIFIIF